MNERERLTPKQNETAQSMRMGRLQTAATILFSTLLPAGAADWEVVDSGISQDILGVEWDGSRFVAVFDETGIMESPDGRNWTTRVLPPEDEPGAFIHRDIVADGGQYLILGQLGEYRESNNFVDWSDRTTGFPETVDAGVWQDGTFLLVGEGGVIITSEDGINWNRISTSPTTNPISCVDFGKGLFVAGSFTGFGDRVFTSPDGLTWTSRATDAFYPVTGASVNDERFVVVTWGEVLTSTEGSAWTKTTIQSSELPYFRAVCASDSKFVMVGRDGVAFETTNGSDVSQIDLLASGHFNDIAYGAGAFVAVGEGGLVRVSGQVEVPPQRPARLSIGKVNETDPGSYNGTISITGQAGESYRIEFSDGLSVWQPSREVEVGASGSASFQFSSDSPKTFYRAFLVE